MCLDRAHLRARLCHSPVLQKAEEIVQISKGWWFPLPIRAERRVPYGHLGSGLWGTLKASLGRSVLWAAAVGAVTYLPHISSWLDTAPYKRCPCGSGASYLEQVPLIARASTRRKHDKRMSKQAAAPLGQRAQTLARAVENGGRKQNRKWSRGVLPRNCRQLQAFLWQRGPPPATTVGSKPSLSPPSSHYGQGHIFLRQWLLKNNTKTKFSRLLVVKDNA